MITKARPEAADVRAITVEKDPRFFATIGAVDADDRLVGYINVDTAREIAAWLKSVEETEARLSK